MECLCSCKCPARDAEIARLREENERLQALVNAHCDPESLGGREMEARSADRWYEQCEKAEARVAELEEALTRLVSCASEQENRIRRWGKTTCELSNTLKGVRTTLEGKP